MKKTYYWCRLTQQSPLRIGTGFGDKTDSDVMKDSRGLPFIPGTSLTGVLRSLLSEEDAVRLFGDIVSKLQQSLVLVSDAVLPADTKSKDFRVTQRDGVGLNDDGTTVEGAKYDFEVVECKKPYTAVLELADAAAPADQTLLEALLARIEAHGVCFGARTTRGYGRMSVEVRKRSFELPLEFGDWLAFDPFAEACFDQADGIETPQAARQEDLIEIRFSLKFPGSFFVRINTTALAGEGQHVAPDQTPLTNFDGHAVIPGTAWAGSFRHHMRHLAQGLGRPDLMDAADELFGAAGTRKVRSSIRFSETDTKGDARYTTTRTAVDRYTAAPRSQALFTAQVAQGGEGELMIQLPADTAPDLLRLLACAINDLHLGLFNVGGEGGVGRGLCEVTSLHVDGTDMTGAMQKLETDYLLKKEAC